MTDTWLRLAAITVVAAGLTALAVVFQDTLMLCLMAGLVALILAPAVKWLEAKRMPRGLAVALIFLVFFATLTGAFFLVVPGVFEQVQHFAQTLPSLLERLSRLPEQLEGILAQRGLHVELSRYSEQVGHYLQQGGIQGVQAVGAMLPGVINNALQGLLALILSIYLVADGPRIRSFFHRVLGTQRQPLLEKFLAVTGDVFGGYFRGLGLLAVIIGPIVGLGCWAIGVPYALVLGLIAGLAEFIPAVGPLITLLLIAVVGLATNPWLALWGVGFYVLIMQVEGNVLQPRLIGGSLGIHPLALLLAMLIGSKLLGLFGLFLSAPACAILWRLWRPRLDTNSPAV